MGSGGISPPFVKSALDGGVCSVSPGGRSPDTNWIWCCVSPSVDLDAVNKGKISRPFRDSKGDRPARSQLWIRLYNLYIFLLLFLLSNKIKYYPPYFLKHKKEMWYAEQELIITLRTFFTEMTGGHGKSPGKNPSQFCIEQQAPKLRLHQYVQHIHFQKNADFIPKMGFVWKRNLPHDAHSRRKPVMCL